MKKLIKKLPKKLSTLFLSLLIIAGLTTTALAGFGPSRPTKAWDPSVDGFDHVTFNSFTGVGNGVGDERDFFRGLQVGRDSTWTDPVNNVAQDAEVEGKIYIHNGADARLNDQPGNPGVAKNVNVRVAMPTGVAQTQDTTAFISADNANPGTIYDTLTTTGANNGYFGLDYEPGTAVLHNQDGSTSVLSDNLVTSGVNIGDQKGCFQYVREVTFKMKVKMPRYTVQKMVRFDGQGPNDWKENIAVKRGQTVEWKVDFNNIGRVVLNHVAIVDEVPANLSVVAGSVKLVSSNFPTGKAYGPEAVQKNGTQINVDMGGLNPDSNAVVLFKTKVADNEALKCGNHELVNKVWATPEYPKTTITDTASVTVEGEKCVPVTPTTPTTPTTTTVLPNTGPGDVIGIFSAVTIAGAFLYRKFLLRKV